MRNITSLMAANLEKHIQTEAERSAPSAYVMIQRNQIPLTESKFIERRKIADLPSLTDSDIAISHTRLHRPDEVAWVAYVSDGELGVKFSDIEESVKALRWTNFDMGVDDEVTACAIAFNSVVKEDNHGIQELCTEEYPWVFWITDGALKARNLNEANSNEIITLAESNTSDVSVIRGPGDKDGVWEFGLIAFFIAGGSIFYRQLINGTWYDAEIVQAGPQNVTYSKISAFNTWNYRVGLQILTDTGDLYELFSYTEGIGVRGSEHMEASPDIYGKLLKIERYNASETEHMEAQASISSEIIYGLPAVPVSAENIDDGYGIWSSKVKVTMDYPCTAGDVSEFIMTDEDNVRYNPIDYEIDGREIILTFLNFSLSANKHLTVKYTKGTLMSPAVLANSFTIEFIPTHLTEPIEGVPEIESITNKADGTEVYLHFTDPITYGISESIDDLTVVFDEYNMVPDGHLVQVTRTIDSLELDEDDDTLLTAHIKDYNISNAIGNVNVVYVNTGMLAGDNGPVLPFNVPFTPTGLTWVGHHNDAEHMEVEADITAELIYITKYNTAENEHMEAEASINAELINVRDL